MKNYLVVFTLLLAAVTAPAAPPTDQSIEQMMDVMRVKEMVDQMLTQVDTSMRAGMEQGMQRSLDGKAVTDAQKAKVADFQKRIAAMMKDELSYAKMKDIYLQVYRETFTQEEVNSIITFYSSPAGKAMVEKIPLSMQKASTLMQARMGPMMQKFQALGEQFEKDLKK